MENPVLNTIITASIGIIALAALFVTVWQVITTRKHNRLSVRPCLRIDRHTILGGSVGIALTNKGIGPAIIKKFEVFVEGKPVISDEHTPPVGTALLQIGYRNVDVSLWTIKEGESLSPNDLHYLVELHNYEITSQNIQKVWLDFKKITFRIVYESMYGEKFYLDEKKESKS